MKRLSHATSYIMYEMCYPMRKRDIRYNSTRKTCYPTANTKPYCLMGQRTIQRENVFTIAIMCLGADLENMTQDDGGEGV